MNAVAPQASFLGQRRTALVRQSKTAECGLACLAMVANHHGHDPDLAAMRRRFGATSRGMGMRQLMQAADARGLKRSLAQAALLNLLLQLYALATPYLLQVAVDDALPAFDTDLLATVAVGFALFAIVNAVALLLRAQVLLAAGTSKGFGIASNVARHLFRLPINWFEKRGIGDVLSRFQSVAPIQLLLPQNASAAAIDGVLALLTLALMLVYSPAMTLVPITGLVLYAALPAATLGPKRRAQNDRIVAQGKEQGAMIETLRGIVTLRLAGTESMRHAVWQNRLSEALGAGYAHDRVKAMQVAGAALLTSLEIVALVWRGARGDGGRVHGGDDLRVHRLPAPVRDRDARADRRRGGLADVAAPPRTARGHLADRARPSRSTRSGSSRCCAPRRWRTMSRRCRCAT